MSCLQRYEAPEYKSNQREPQIIWKDVKVLSKCRPRKSGQTRAASVTPAALSPFSVEDRGLPVTWCYHLFSHPEVLKYFQQFSSAYAVRPRWRCGKSSLRLLKSQETGNLCCRGLLFGSARVIAQYSLIINAYFVASIYSFPPPHPSFSVNLC